MNCEKCGTPLPEGVSFCGECGAPVMEAPAEAAQTPEAPEQMPVVPAENITPAAPKKSHTGLIIAIAAVCVIALGVLIAGLCTNWFRAKQQGPMDEMKAVCKAAFPEKTANGTANVRATISGFGVDIPVQYDMDRENPENSALYADFNVLGSKIVIGMYQRKLIIASNGYVQANDLGKTMPATGTASMKKDGKYDTESYFREAMDEEQFEKFAEETDFAKLNEAMQELEDDFNDEAWMKEFCDYTREEADDTVTYHINTTPELFDEIKRIVSPAYKGEDDIDEMFAETMGGIGDILPPENLKLDLVAVAGKMDKAVIGIEVDGSLIELELSFSDIGTTEVDRDALQELLDSERGFDW